MTESEALALVRVAAFDPRAREIEVARWRGGWLVALVAGSLLWFAIWLVCKEIFG